MFIKPSVALGVGDSLVLKKLSQETIVESDSFEWRADMKKATSKIMPKIVIVRKSKGCKIYHVK